MLVVAYAIAGTVDIDLQNDAARSPTRTGTTVFLKDIWPTQRGGRHLAVRSFVTRSSSRPATARRLRGRPRPGRPSTRPPGQLYAWDATQHLHPGAAVLRGHAARGAQARRRSRGAKVLVKCGVSTTTDHISPAGVIPKESPAADYLRVQRRRAEGLQQLRLPARQRPGDDPGHLRQCPAEEPARARHRGRLHDLPRAERHSGRSVPLADLRLATPIRRTARSASSTTPR